jgi:D-alanine-D-alanine ligase
MPLSECTYPANNGPRFLTFDAKWKAETHAYQTTIAKCPCELDPQVEAQIKSIALRAYSIMGCRDYARVDFRLAGSTPYVLEVNPNPRINPNDSACVLSGKANGITFDELIKQILTSSILSACAAGRFYPAVARRARATAYGWQASPSPL